MSRSGVWTLLDVAVPGLPAESAGVLLADTSSDRLYSRFRRDLPELFPEDADILEAMAGDLDAKAEELGAGRLLDWLNENASNFFRVSDQERVDVEDFPSTLQWLYHRHIRPKVLPFRTHLPLYSLQAAAGKWGPNRDVETEPDEWLEAPPDLRLAEDMFVCQVVGRSMEPLIPAGSLCVFRGGAALAGSRQGKRVLVVNYGEPGDQRFTVKRYESVKRQVDEENEVRDRIVLHPLNPEYEAWEIDPAENDRVAVIGEFVRVLPD